MQGKVCILHACLKSAIKINWSGNMLDSTNISHKKITLKEVISLIPQAEREKLAGGYDMEKFAAIFNDKDMMATCESLFKNNLNVSETARKMYMHRNTLIYRVNKIKRITGLNVSNFSQAVTFIVLHILYTTKKK
jgi:carbohydrate diacid regulator